MWVDKIEAFQCMANTSRRFVIPATKAAGFV